MSRSLVTMPIVFSESLHKAPFSRIGSGAFVGNSSFASKSLAGNSMGASSSWTSLTPGTTGKSAESSVLWVISISLKESVATTFSFVTITDVSTGRDGFLLANFAASKRSLFKVFMVLVISK